MSVGSGAGSTHWNAGRCVATIALAVLAACGCGDTSAAEIDKPSALSSRAKATLLGVVVPTFPKDLAPGQSLDVALRFRVAADGKVDHVEIASEPGGMDAETVAAVKKWFVVPALCSDLAWRASEVRTALSFRREGEQSLVTIKDPRWYASGEQVDLPTIDGTTQLPRLKRIKGDDPVFPTSVLRRGIYRGSTAAQIKIGVDGKVVDIPRLFSWPPRVFENTTRSALEEWTMGNADGTPFTEPVLACIQINFSVKQP